MSPTGETWERATPPSDVVVAPVPFELCCICTFLAGNDILHLLDMDKARAVGVADSTLVVVLERIEVSCSCIHLAGRDTRLPLCNRNHLLPLGLAAQD